MEKIERLKVSLLIEQEHYYVGELLLNQRQIYFKYHADFLDSGLLLSPLKLPLSPAVLKAETTVFDGLFGVFSDSLPDGWGRLLLDRSLTTLGIIRI
jgi:serine/threonine-protein kinase HipA